MPRTIFETVPLKDIRIGDTLIDEERATAYYVQAHRIAANGDAVLRVDGRKSDYRVPAASPTVTVQRFVPTDEETATELLASQTEVFQRYTRPDLRAKNIKKFTEHLEKWGLELGIDAAASFVEEECALQLWAKVASLLSPKVKDGCTTLEEAVRRVHAETADRVLRWGLNMSSSSGFRNAVEYSRFQGTIGWLRSWELHPFGLRDEL